MDSRYAQQQPKPFLGVRFILFGFTSINEHQVKSKLVNGGGVDVGQYTQDCTHVIVDKLVYDDPPCVAAREDSKILVTGLWVDHSFDIGMPVDHTSIMYRPLKDLNGIPGAESFIMCLTGYQRQDRDDVMTMVGLIGAQFSKPLVANKVTHLICYKFEGEKYELAKKMKKIQLVNHKWLEDCLSYWKILPEANYSKSGYELEMEAEAKDSEEEAEDSIAMQFRGRKMNSSPHSIQVGLPRAHELHTSVGVVSKIPLDTTVSIGPSNVINHKDIPSVMGKDTNPSQATSLNNVFEKHHQELGYQKTQNTTKFAGLHDQYDGTPIYTKVGNDLTSTSASANKSPHSGVGKLSGMSYSRKSPRTSTLQTEISGNLTSFPKLQSGERKTSDGLDISPFKAEQALDRSGFNCFNTPSKGSGILHEEEFTSLSRQKRKMDASCASSKSQKMGHDSIPRISVGPSANNEVQRLESTPLTRGPSEINEVLAVDNNGIPQDEPALLNSAKRSPADMLRTKSSTYRRRSLKSNLPVSEIGLDSNAENARQHSFERSEESAFACKPHTMDAALGRSVHEVGGTGELQKWQQDTDASSPKYRTLEFAKSHSPVALIQENDASHLKPVEKMVSKKSLGSRPKLGTSCKTNSANKKGSIYLDRTGSQNDAAVCSVDGKGTVSHEEPCSADKLEVPSCLINKIETLMEMNPRDAPKPGNDIENKNESMDDETEAPDDKIDELEKAVNHMSEVAEVTLKPDVMMDEMSEGGQHITKTSTDNATASEGDHENVVDGKDIELGESTFTTDAVRGKITNGKMCPLGKKKINTVGAVTKNLEDERKKSSTDNATASEGDHEKVVDGKDIELRESTCTTDAVRGKMTKGKKRPLGKNKTNTVRTVRKNLEDERNVVGDDTGTEKSFEKIEMEERGPNEAAKTQSNALSVNKLDNTMELEKENKPMISGDKSMGGNKQCVGEVAVKSGTKKKVAVKSNRTALKKIQKAGKVDPDSVQVGGAKKKVKTEPMWFILSGHRLQRKEFQKIIRQLKGRICRDSHQWSYQATHFIVPDPIKRTEKLLAAAASGRWILNSDYLSASSQAGKFLAEELYEWHKNGLSEDGAINLEAPRKWRLLREKTGHGAFNGMRIIIYGECIAPPLDTLKRAVKAGDGTILATSPPYTRFLNSGVDFAVVSPGMPRVDMWVQEFLKHEVPCVLADYLVEYVCKPGYSLERHVQYNTHAWAEKSFANLLGKSEEIVEDFTPPDAHSENDITCQVCQSSDRGEVMLICGDESGSVGCGIGTHIDCCNPPLEEVPEEDWFCPSCRSKNSSSTPKNSKKRPYKSK